ncbi:tryptophan 2,3- dioxygenase [Dispira parvispora]|uniref:Tryptophan 2,3- dioxygenase n=1 Tax=Dispira parvispora TaxID=1520584 RepID=A0A9W8E4Z0_9FUNG|nr:tryptophan 2,3- dioxygenase [Dispira parvispora]
MSSAIRLEDYDVSPITGFLPEEPALTRLPNPYYEPWERINDNLQAFIITRKLWVQVEKLPVLETDQLSTMPEKRRAFTLLAFFAHAYIWGDRHDVRDYLPAPIAVPWVRLADEMEMKPIICSPSVVSWNWRKLDPESPLELDNMTVLQTFTGSTDEAWFYLITGAVEARAVELFRRIPGIFEAIEKEDHQALVEHLGVFHAVLSDCTHILERMYEQCDPYVFYWKIHPFLAGWNNMKSAGLPHGVLYHGVDDIDMDPDDPCLNSRRRRYAGGSAAQASGVHVFDILLGVQHYPTGLSKTERSDDKRKDAKLQGGNFLEAMRTYMPGPHRRFLEYLDRNCRLRDYVLTATGASVLDDLRVRDPAEVALRTQLLQVYNACVAQVRAFRDSHIKMVTRYIVSPARKGPSLVNMMTPQAKQDFRPSPPTTPITPAPGQLPLDDVVSDTPAVLESMESQTPPEGISNLSSRLTHLTSLFSLQRLRNYVVNEPISPALTPDSSSVDFSAHLHDSAIPSRHTPDVYNNLQSNPLSAGIADQCEGALTLKTKSQHVVGSGGTDAMKFLKQVRDETKEAQIQPM